MDLNISLAPEPIFHLGPWAITNSILTGWIVVILLLLGAAIVRHQLKPVPTKTQNVVEIIYEGLLDLISSSIGRREVAEEITPYILTLFTFIVVSSWLGLLPGVATFGFLHHDGTSTFIIPFLRSPTTDLNAIAVLALFSMGYIQYLGFKYAGPKTYLRKFFDFSSPMNFMIGLMELLSEFTRLITFIFRLFGNIFAGEALISVIILLTVSLVPFVAILPLPFLAFEFFIGFIQAFVFCILTVILVSLAVSGHDDEQALESSVSTPSIPNNASL